MKKIYTSTLFWVMLLILSVVMSGIAWNRLKTTHEAFWIIMLGLSVLGGFCCIMGMIEESTNNDK